MFTAAVISVGDELTCGHRVDTNSAWISNELVSMGIPVVLHLSVGDDLQQCASAIRYAGSVSSLIVMTGGLGPTADDITRQAIAEATGRELMLDPQSLSHIETIFARRGRSMTPSNRIQAMFPIGTDIVHNPHGTAPGIDLVTSFQDKKVRLIALPGVPAEAQEMFAETIRMRLSRSEPSLRMIRSYTIKCFGMGESDLESKLGNLTARGRDPLVGITVHEATISLRITAQGGSETECAAAAAPTLAEIRRLLGPLVFGEERDELQDAIVRLFGQEQLTLAVADLFSRGLLCRWLGEGDPTSAVFRGGLVTDSMDRLEQMLIFRQPAESNSNCLPQGVDSNVQLHCEPNYNREILLARSLRQLFATDIALVLTPSSVHDSESGSLNVAIAGPRASYATELLAGGHPEIRIARGAKTALNVLRQRYSGLR